MADFKFAPTQRLLKPDGDSLETQSMSSCDGSTVDLAHRMDSVQGIRDRQDLAERLAKWHQAQLVAGGQRYVPANVLGRGGQGLVFGVEDRDAGREIAVKVLRGDRTSARHAQRFVNEARITAQLQHPGIVPVYDIGMLPDGALYYVMKRVAGRSLQDILAEQGGQAERRFALTQLVLKVCDTMAFAHDRGVVHRDLKPSNIMVGDYGEVLVVDWGLAKVVKGGQIDLTMAVDQPASQIQLDDESGVLTIDGHAVGTPAYMSPEQARGENDIIDGRADLYGIGVILYESLSARLPYDVTGSAALIEAVALAKIIPLAHAAPKAPKPLVAIVEKAMAYERSDRYATAAELAKDLRRFMAGERVSCYQETVSERVVRAVRKHRHAVLTAVAVTMLAVAAWGAWWTFQQVNLADRIDELEFLAGQAEDRGDLELALAHFERMLELQSNHEIAIDGRLRVRALVATRQQEQAAQEVERTNARRAEEIIAEAEGLIISASDLGRAKELFTQAHDLLPNGSPRRRAVLDRHIEVQAMLSEQATRERNRRAAAMLKAAEAHLQSRQWTRAEAQLLAASELIPTNDYMQEMAQRIDEGVTADEQARIAAEAEELLGKARALRLREAYSEAVSATQAALELNPTDAATELLKTLVIERTEQEREKARQASEHAAFMLLTSAEEKLREVSHHRQQVQSLSLQLSNADLSTSVTALRANLDREREAVSAAQAKAIGLLHAAYQRAPELSDARLSLVEFYRQRVEEAERDCRFAEAAAMAAQGSIYDIEKKYPLLFGGLCEVQAVDQPIFMFRPGDNEPIQLMAGRPRQIPFGVYRVESSDGVRAQRVFRRGLHYSLTLDRMPRVTQDTAFVPSGPIYDSEQDVVDTIAGFLIGKREVTNREWLEFLNDPQIQNTLTYSDRGVLELVPRLTFDAKESLWKRQDTVIGQAGLFELALRTGEPLNPDAPVMGISAQDVAQYVEWRRHRDGLAWRLPTEQEWQLAAQAGDGRRFAWGNDPDVDRCYSHQSKRHQGYALQATASFPHDQTIHGVFDLAGSVCEITATTWPGDQRLVVYCGGSWADHDEQRFETWSQRAVHQRRVSTHIGFRLALSLAAGGPQRSGQ